MCDGANDCVDCTDCGDSRRSFLKGVLGLGGMGLLGSAGLGWPGTGFSQEAAGELATAIPRGLPDCFDHQVVGICFCGPIPVPCGFRVRHYLPVAVVETVKDQWDSVLIPGDAGGFLSGTRRLDTAGTQRGAKFEAHVWRIDDNLRALLTGGLSQCGWCSDSSARSFGTSSSGLDSVESAGGVVSCSGSPASIAAALNSVGANPIGGFDLPLVYASELDNYHWHTGCRDLPRASARAALVPPMCAVRVPDYLRDAISSYVPDIGSPITGGISTDDVCVGQLGPLYPRQMHGMGKTDPTAAVVTAYRAMHLAEKDIGTFQIRVNQDSKFQPLYPNVNTCFRVTDDPELIESKIGRSDDGRFAFIYWASVTCCISFQEYGCTVASG